MRKFLLLIVSLSLFISCKDSADKANAESTEENSSVITDASQKEADMRKVALNIEGMTCEIGCARTIQSKLSKKEGIASAEVNFEAKRGIVEYDANKISEKEIVATVENIAGGDLYKITEISATE